MGRPDYDPAANDEPLYMVPEAGVDYLYASQDPPARLTEGYVGGYMTGDVMEIKAADTDGD